MPGQALPRPLRAACGIRIRAHRKALGWTQAVLSARSSVVNTQLSRMENGQTAGLVASVLRLAWAMGVEPGSLLPDLEELTTMFGTAPEGK